MFESKDKSEKLRGPREIPQVVKNCLIQDWKEDADTPNFLQAVIRKKEPDDKSFYIRIFDPDEAQAKKCTVNNYISLDAAPDLIFYEGFYTEKSKNTSPKCELVQKKKADFNIELLTKEQIQAKIEALREPGSSFFIYLSAGPGSGGPLGRGAAIIELLPTIPGKKPRYTIYTTDVLEMQPVGKGNKLWESDKPNDIANWAKQGHNKRFC